jgi:hypothetical protein
MAGPWEEYQGKSSPEAKPWEEFGATQEKAKGPGAIRKAGDLAVGIGGTGAFGDEALIGPNLWGYPVDPGDGGRCGRVRA